MRSILLLFFCFLVLIRVNGQSAAQCSRSLNQAEVAFDQGRLLAIINGNAAQFQKCLDEGILSKEEQIRAYKLLTKTYIFLDREKEAEENLVKLLRVDKEHNLAKDDPAELYFLYEKFQTEPIFRVGFRIGVNSSNPFVMQTFSTAGSTKKYNGQSDAGLGVGFWGEALIEKYLTNGFELVAGPQIQIANYKVEQNFSGLTSTIQNRSTMIKAPLFIRYNYGYGKKDSDNNRIKWIPYVFAGGSFDYVIDAKYVNTDRSGGNPFTLPSNKSDLLEKDQIHRSNISLTAGLGAKLRIENVNFFTFEIRYNNSLFNYINEENRYAFDVVNTDIGYIEDDLTINTLAFSVGYTRSLYKPRKRKQYR